MKDWKTWVLVLAGIGLLVYVVKFMNAPKTGTGPVLSVNPGPPDPGQLQNIAQAFQSMSNSVTATPHPVLSVGNTGSAQSKSQ